MFYMWTQKLSPKAYHSFVSRTYNVYNYEKTNKCSLKATMFALWNLMAMPRYMSEYSILTYCNCYVDNGSNL